jgi:hypothetical protein
MAAKKRTKRPTEGSTTPKKGATKKGATKKGAVKKGAAKSAARREPIDLRSASAATQQRVFRALSAALREAGVVGQLGRIEVEGLAEAEEATFGAAAGRGACPDGFILRLVCEKRGGTVVCEERCVPE